jgi:hypothetical protein
MKVVFKGLIVSCLILLTACATTLRKSYDEKYRTEITANYIEAIDIEGADITENDLLTKISIPNFKTILFFTKKGHPIHPTQIIIEERDDDKYWSWISVTGKTEFNSWITNFLSIETSFDQAGQSSVKSKAKACGSFKPTNPSSYGNRHKIYKQSYLIAQLRLMQRNGCFPID